jgi:hypothetical protein
VNASKEQRRQWEVAAEKSHSSLAEWIVDALDHAAHL